MSQDSSHYSSSRHQSSTVICKCGKQLCQLTSFTDDNFERRFLRCANYRSLERCDFFKWIDPPMCEYGRRVLSKLKQRRELPESSRERVNRNGGNVENSWKFICLSSWCILLGVAIGVWIKDKFNI